jgi:hypothetical protein
MFTRDTGVPGRLLGCRRSEITLDRRAPLPAFIQVEADYFAHSGMLGLTKSYVDAFAPTVRVDAFGPSFMETSSTLERSG